MPHLCIITKKSLYEFTREWVPDRCSSNAWSVLMSSTTDLMSSQTWVGPPCGQIYETDLTNCWFITVFILLLQHVSVNITLNQCGSSATTACFARHAAPSLKLANDACPAPRLRAQSQSFIPTPVLSGWSWACDLKDQACSTVHPLIQVEWGNNLTAGRSPCSSAHSTRVGVCLHNGQSFPRAGDLNLDKMDVKDIQRCPEVLGRSRAREK